MLDYNRANNHTDSISSADILLSLRRIYSNLSACPADEIKQAHKNKQLVRQPATACPSLLSHGQNEAT